METIKNSEKQYYINQLIRLSEKREGVVKCMMKELTQLVQHQRWVAQ
jgi:hypothetical protein